MPISYGPPGHKGVTHLMAIGDVDQTTTDQAVTTGMWLGFAGLAVGILVGSPLLRGMGAGAAIACGAIRQYSGAAGSTVAVATAPASSSATPAQITQLPGATSDYFDGDYEPGWP